MDNGDFYRGYIRNITKDKWVETEKKGTVTLTTSEEKRLIFNDKTDAESTLAHLNDEHSDAYTLYEAPVYATVLVQYHDGEAESRTHAGDTIEDLFSSFIEANDDLHLEPNDTLTFSITRC